MDRMIYTVANGATRVMDHQAALANNLANSSTTGFRAQFAAYRSVPVTTGSGDPATTTRVLTVATTADSLYDHGPMQATGRPLDLAIEGDGWLAVQTPDGEEAYTRAGNLQMNAQGQLVTMQGNLVLSAEGEPITLGDVERVAFGRDGGVNVIPQGGNAQDIQQATRLKLVNPEVTSLVRGDDGLFRSRNAEGQFEAAEPDPDVRVMGGMLEGSNVSAAKTMVELIENSRRYEMQMKVISEASQNAQSANSILSATA